MALRPPGSIASCRPSNPVPGPTDYANGPAYPIAPELAKRTGVPEGKVIEFVMNSSESKFYPGVNAAFQRHVCVYVPAGYAGAELPVIVSADAYGMCYNLLTMKRNIRK
jgi:hypothetical protein